MWPDLLRGMLWIHFIDNDAALASIVRGSSSVASGDVIISWTWRHVMELKAWLWVERVASKSNPVDGLSRGRLAGPWEHIEQVWIDLGSIRELQREVEFLRAENRYEFEAEAYNRQVMVCWRTQAPLVIHHIGWWRGPA